MEDRGRADRRERPPPRAPLARLEAGVFCSATLATHGMALASSCAARDLGGLRGPGLVETLPHIFDYKKSALLMLPAHLPTPRDEALKKEFPEAVAAEFQRFLPYFHGRTLGLFTARSRMRMVHEQSPGHCARRDTRSCVRVRGRWPSSGRSSRLGTR